MERIHPFLENFPTRRYRMATRIYTRTGDKGETGLYGAGRVRKDSARVEAYGTVDEANSAIGLSRSFVPGGQLDDVSELLASIQDGLLAVGADLATPLGSRFDQQIERIDEDDVAYLEERINDFTEECPLSGNFVHPGGHPAAAALHIARTITRRAERRVVKLAREEELNPEVQVYLNRLADLLFMAARVINKRLDVAEEEWLVRRGD